MLDVPKFTVVFGGSFVQEIMPWQVEPMTAITFMWPNSRISVMGGEQASGVLIQVKEEQLPHLAKQMKF